MLKGADVRVNRGQELENDEENVDFGALAITTFILLRAFRDKNHSTWACPRHGRVYVADIQLPTLSRQ